MTAQNLYALVNDEDGNPVQWFPVVIGGASSITFDLCPEFELPIQYRRRGVRTPAEAGFVQRRTLWPEGDLRTFSLGWRTMNSAERARLKDLFARARGPVRAMNYTTPTGDTTLVRFKRPALSLRPRAPEAWETTVELEEVR